jgi:hypothetical protein
MAGTRKRFGSLPQSRRLIPLIRDRTTGELRPPTDDEVQTVEKESAAWFQELLDADRLPGFPGAQDIAAKLQVSAQDQLRRRQIQKTPSRGLTILGVSYLLATLRVTKPEDLPRVVDKWLQWLGIDRVSRPRGRPRAKQTEMDHYVWFTVFQQVIEKTQVWSRKQELKRQHPRRWKNPLREVLHKDECWEPKEIELVISSKTAHTLALNLTATKLNIKPDTVARSVRRRSRSRS